jgi:hypothetical protein
VHFDHYSEAGVDRGKLDSIGGQIRTNQRIAVPWVLKEMKTALDCSVQPCIVEVVPVSVGLNPFGLLYDSTEELTAQPWSDRVPLFQADFLLQRDVLASGLSAIDFTYAPSSEFNAAESPVTTADSDYFALTDAVFMADIEDAGPAGFTGEQLTNRATALNCAGCHDPSMFGLTMPDALGPGISFPDSLRFVHTHDVIEIVLPTDTVFGTGEGFALSPALVDAFLPARADHLVNELNQEMCVCQAAAEQVARQAGGDDVHDPRTDDASIATATPFRTTPGEDLAAAVQAAIDGRPIRRTTTGSYNAHCRIGAIRRPPGRGRCLPPST